jgi:glyoxylase-like metal-dependent hydrolase (beta-lactamase superfamily II)
MVRYRWRLLRAGEFRLDGGSMFGVIPRAVWSRSVKPDEHGRIAVQHNCLLLERLDEPPASRPGARPMPAPKLIVLEVGTGDKLDAGSRKLFEMGDRTIQTTLQEAACRAEDIGGVVVSHLHFDHAGGLTRLARPGEKPEWMGPASSMTSSRGEHGVVRSFPNARVFVQAREWADARENKSVMTRTYFADHLESVAAQVELVDSPRPFALGVAPGKAQAPIGRVSERRTEIMPGVWVFLVPGHTWGQQATMFVDDSGRTVVFTPDVLPTVAHNGAAYSLAYDVEPYTSMLSRRWFLEEAAVGDWLLVLDHEPGHPCVRVRANAKGWFDLIPDEAGRA